jgi:sterol desaturase/sphingolipid hydroxylase (fatty acid hydroxylase superfamily)
MDVRAYMVWVTLGAVIVLLAEVAMGRHKGVYNRKGEFRLLALNMALGRFLIGPAMAVIIAAIWAMLLPRYRGTLADTPLWLALPSVMLFCEFFFYWVHRCAHEGIKNRSLLWMVHRTHHSATYMNVSVWMRLNVFWYMIIPNAWTMGLVIYLGLGEAAGLVILLIAVWNIVTHSDFRWDDAVRRHRWVGPLFRAAEHVIVSPGIHHTHHGFGKDGASYRNFGVMLSIWDWLFGTLHIPEGRPYRYGIPGHNAHWLEELAYPLVRMDKPERSQESPRSVPAQH